MIAVVSNVCTDFTLAEASHALRYLLAASFKKIDGVTVAVQVRKTWHIVQGLTNINDVVESAEAGLVNNGCILICPDSEFSTGKAEESVSAHSSLGSMFFSHGLLVLERGASDVWVASYKYLRMWLVMASLERKALSAATGRCDCLFDERLRVWSVPSKKVALYHVGTTRLDVMDGGEQETPSS